MSWSRSVIVLSVTAAAAGGFLAGDLRARVADTAHHAGYDVELKELRAEVNSLRDGTAKAAKAGTPIATSGTARSDERAALVSQIKQDLQNEMGMMPLGIVRARQSSFVELYATDNQGHTSYGTAGYLGNGYFVTVKHAVVALGEEGERDRRRITSIKVTYRGKEVPAKLVDAGDADVEVHSGDWAIIKTRPLDLPALSPNLDFSFEFAEPIVRLGNDYSRGIMPATRYVGQRMPNGLVTCLTDGHPGVSGGGVLNREGELVGIPIGRMAGDYRFSFILPIRAEMFRKIKPAPATPTTIAMTAVTAGAAGSESH
jgi:hypothetical protein